MNKDEFIKDKDVKRFVDFITDKWFGGLDFSLGIKASKGRGKAVYVQISSINDALNNYVWGYSIKTELQGFDIPDKFKKGKLLHESETVLKWCKDRLIVNDKLNVNDAELRAASEVAMKWGGVFDLGNNGESITNQEYKLLEKYNNVSQKWNSINLEHDSSKNTFTPNDKYDFTSNAGFTKIYSLILNDFIIYDSRVSVALAYLMEICFGDKIPQVLKIYIPAGRVPDDKRTVSSFFEKTNNETSKHFYSNIISSLLLSEVLKKIKLRDNAITLRDIEAALFMIGYDIRNGRIEEHNTNNALKKPNNRVTLKAKQPNSDKLYEIFLKLVTDGNTTPTLNDLKQSNSNINEASISATLYKDCVNHTSRKHYPYGKDRYFHISKTNRYRLYDPSKDGKWDSMGNIISTTESNNVKNGSNTEQNISNSIDQPKKTLQDLIKGR